MPYIKQKRRKELDSTIEMLCQKLYTENYSIGDANYVISSIVCAGFLREPRYKTIAALTGMLNNVSSEFYRRLAAPYEEKACATNGDLPGFMQDKKE